MKQARLLFYSVMQLIILSGVGFIVILNVAYSHSGGLDSKECHGGSKPYHCHRSPNEMVGNRLRCDLGSESEACKKSPSDKETKTLNQSSDTSGDKNKIKFSSFLYVFDTVCIHSFFDKSKFEWMVGLFKNVKVEENKLKYMSVGAEIGYIVRDQGTDYGVTMGKTDSTYCSVFSSDLKHEEAEYLIKNNFSVENISSFKQGASRFSVYNTSLVGRSKDVTIFVQSDSRSGLVISLVDSRMKDYE